MSKQKHLYSVLVSLVTVAGLTAQGQSSYFNQVMSLNPVAYWPLQETTQPPAANVDINEGSYGPIDNLQYSTNGTGIKRLQGPPTMPGAFGENFTGANTSYALVPTTDPRTALTTAQAFTVETWVLPYSYGLYGALISKTGTIPAGGNNAANYKAGFTLAQNYYPLEDDGSGTWSGALYGWSFTVFNGQGDQGGACALCPYEYQTNTWYHLVGVFDGVNAYLYVDGVRADAPDLDTPMPAGTSFLPDTWDPLEFSSSRGIGANDQNIVLSEVAIYTSALSATDINNHYQAAQQGFSQWESAVTADNPVMYYHMNAQINAYFAPDPATCPVANNYGSASANTTNLTILTVDGEAVTNAIYLPGSTPGVAGPSYAGFGSPSYACAFGALGGAVDAGYNSLLNPTGNATPETVVGWFKCAPCDDNGRWNSVISHSDSSFRFKIHNGANVWDSGGGPDVTGPAINVNDGNWHMFAGVYNPAGGGSNIIWIDAALAVSVNTNLNINGKTNYDVFIGGAPDYLSVAGGAQQYFAGSICHVAYFNTALTTAQIQSLYSAAEVPPSILIQPSGYATPVSGNGSASFTVVASGSQTMSYQWWFSNANGTVQLSDGPGIVGSVTSNLNLSALTGSESGSYYVVLNNSYGSVTSSLCNLSVSVQPLVVSQTGSGTLNLWAGQNYTFSVNAVGSNVVYQWYTNGIADTTAGTSSSYTLNDVQLSYSGTTVQCALTNELAAISNTLATVIVSSLPPGLTNGGTYGSNIMALNPTAYWPMHEVAPPAPGDLETNLGTLGTNATAYYGDWDSNNVNIVNFVRNVPGALANDPDTALSFKRAPSSFLTVPQPRASISPPFSIEFFANPEDLTGYQNIIGQGGGNSLDGSGSYGGWDIEYGYSGSGAISNCFSFVLWSGSGSANNELTTPSAYPPNQWYHVVATFDGTNINIYVNGAPVTTFQHGTNVYKMAVDYWSPLVLGAGRWNGAPAQGSPFQGVLDEVAVYTNVLTATQVSQHYANASAANGVYKNGVLALNPIMYYRMDAPPWTMPSRSIWPTLNNYGSFAQNGVYTPGALPGGAQNITVANVGSTVAPLFNGNGAFADAGPITGTPLNPLGYTSFSYTAMFKGAPSDSRSWTDIMSGNDATWRCSINYGSGAVVGHGTADNSTPQVWDDGNWHQVVVTYLGSATALSGTNLVYIDGIVRNTNVTASTNNPASDPGPEACIGNEWGFWVFQTGQTGNDGAERCFTGSICEAAFFNGTVLTPTQIQGLYNTAGVVPFFSKQPVSTNVNQGANFTSESVIVGGSGGVFTYQWYSNGVAMAGQTATNLVINPVLATSGASYTCVANSAFGNGTSAVAVITINRLPQFTALQPSSSTVTVLSGSTLDFAAPASGAAPLNYYWYSNSVLVQQSTVQSFVVSPVSASTAGTYTVIVSNSLGAISNAWDVNVVNVTGNFAAAVLALNPIGFWLMNEPGDGMDPSNSVVCHDYISGNNGVYENTVLGVPGYNWDDMASGIYDTNTAAAFGTNIYQQVPVANNSCAYNISNIVLSTAASGNGEFTVQCWAQTFNENSSSINTPGLVGKGLYNHEEFALDLGNHVASYGAYRFEVRNSAETTVNANTSVIAGSDTNWHFVVGVCDQANGFVYCYIDGTNAGSAAIPENTGIDTYSDLVPVMIGARTSAAAYNPTSMDQQFLGSIADVAIFNYALTSNQIRTEYFAAGIAPQITQQPPGTNIISIGSTLQIPAAAQGSGTLSYQWYDENNNPVPLQTNATLTISDMTTNNVFTLHVADSFGSIVSKTSQVVIVSGEPVVEVDISPTNVAALVGGTATYTVTVDGSPTITYGWQLNGAPVSNNNRISGANTSTLTINDVQASDAGTYQLFATNSFGNTMSSQAALEVFPTMGFNGTGVGWVTNGNTSQALVWLGNNQLQLTSDVGNEDATAFFPTRLYIGAFEASFIYQMGAYASSVPADGVSFCIQNEGPLAVGEGGGGLGVEGLTPSVEWEFNVYPNNSVGGAGVSFNTNGGVGPTFLPGAVVFNGDPILTQVTYVNGLASIMLTDQTTHAVFSTNYNINIPATVGTNMAYVGFTGADGGDECVQTVSDFQFIILPSMTAQLSAHNAVFTWPSAIGDYVLQQSPSLAPGQANWTTVAATETYSNGMLSVSVPISGTGGSMFYRLVLN